LSELEKVMNRYNALSSIANGFCDAGYNHAMQPCPVHQPEYMQMNLPNGYGWRIEWKGQLWGVNGCDSLEEAVHKCAKFAEDGGLRFRERWWQFWRPADPRAKFPAPDSDKV